MKKLLFAILICLPMIVGAQNTNKTITTTGKVAVRTTAPLHNFTGISKVSYANLNALNLVNGDVNKIRTTVAQATDTASVNVQFSYTGSPSLNIKSKTGTSIIKVDSSAVTPNVPMLMYVGDTTVTAKYGTIVFKTSDSTFYGCKYIRPTGKQKWFKIDN